MNRTQIALILAMTSVSALVSTSASADEVTVTTNGTVMIEASSRNQAVTGPATQILSILKRAKVPTYQPKRRIWSTAVGYQGKSIVAQEENVSEYDGSSFDRYEHKVSIRTGGAANVDVRLNGKSVGTVRQNSDAGLVVTIRGKAAQDLREFMEKSGVYRDGKSQFVACSADRCMIRNSR